MNNCSRLCIVFRLCFQNLNIWYNNDCISSRIRVGAKFLQVFHLTYISTERMHKKILNIEKNDIIITERKDIL